jgi:putative flippase GtrA
MNLARYETLLRHPLAGRLTRYTLGSVVAATTSAIVFAALYAAGVGTTADSILAFIAGAIPNWFLNRRWAWRRRGPVRFRKEILGYAATSAACLVAASLATAWTKSAAQSLGLPDPVTVVLVTGSYLAVFGVTFLAKFAIYELWVFGEPGRRGAQHEPQGFRSAARRRRISRTHVATTTRANRVP